MTEARTVYWTRFPARAMTGADWSDPWAAHRSVMRLFPQQLPGPESERRSQAGILYRVDVVNSEPVVLVQSLIPPELLPAGARTLEFDPLAWRLNVGTQVVFRVAYNPVVRNSVKDTDATRVRITERALLPDQSEEWLMAKLSRSLQDIVVLNTRRTILPQKDSRKRQSSAPPRLTVDVTDASAVVADAQAFTDLRTHGLGRAKSYGCGLLTAQPMS